MAESGLLILGEEKLQKRLDAMILAVDDEAILDEAEAIILNKIRTRFLAEVDPNNTPWTPSKAGQKRRSKGGTGTLYKTGTLFHSIQASAPGPNLRVIGTDVLYAKYHNEGIGQVKREFMNYNDDDLLLIEKLIILRIEGAMA